MNAEHDIDDATLMAYADGELPAAEATRVEAAIAADPALAAAVERHRQLRDRLVQAFAPVAEEPVPDRLRALLEPAADRTTPAAVPIGAASAPATAPATGHRRGRRRLRWTDWSALAACVLFGALLSRAWSPYFGTAPAPLVDARLQARGALQQALTQRLGTDGPSAQGIAMGPSFRTRDGGYCRSFSLAQARPMAGLACREDRGWRVTVLAEQAAGPGGDLRQAGAALPPAVLEAVDARIEGEPLDAAGERAARSARWRTK